MKWVTGWSWPVSITGPKSLSCVRLLIFDAWADSPFCCLQVTGVILLAVGVWGKVSLETYFSLAAEESTNAPYVLIGTGAIIVIFGLFGCFATCRGSPWMLKLVGERAVGDIPSLRDDLAWLFFFCLLCFSVCHVFDLGLPGWARGWSFRLHLQAWGELNLQLVRLNQNETVTWPWGNVCHLFSWVKVSRNRLKQVQHHKRWNRAITWASAAKRWIPLLWYPLSLSQVSASTTQSQPLCYVCDAFILNSSDQSHAGQRL